ncbi:MAG: metallophosphoesterase family protein [Thermomicrobiales bacterium]
MDLSPEPEPEPGAFALTDQRSFDAPLTIGVLSDTHIYAHGQRTMPPEIPDLFRRFAVGLILHGGDVSTGQVLAELQAIAPVLAVQGNNDPSLRSMLPLMLRFSVGRFRFHMVHGHHLGKTARSTALQLAGAVDCVVYGHSHIPKFEEESGTILFNPGSATDRRWQEHFGVGLIHVSADGIKPELVLFKDPRHLVNVKP